MKSNSWIVIEKATKKVVCEIFEPAQVRALNTVKYEAIPAHIYLGELNAKIKEADEKQQRN